MNSETGTGFVPLSCHKRNQTHCLIEQENYVDARRNVVFDCTWKEAVEGFHLVEYPKEQWVASQEICSRKLVHHIQAVKNKEVMSLHYWHWKGVRKTVLGSMVVRNLYTYDLEQQKVHAQVSHYML